MLAMLRDLSQVAKLAPLGILAAFVQCGSMAGGAVLELNEGKRGGDYLVIAAIGPIWGASLATYMFGFGAIATLPTVRSQMADTDELPGAFKVAMVIVVSIYMSIMAIGYLGFGPGVADNMINSISDGCGGFRCHIGTVANVSIIINLLISAPTFCFCVVNAFESAGTSMAQTAMTMPNIAFRAMLIVCLTFVSSRLPFPKEIIGLLSAIFASANSIFLPVACHYGLKRKLKAQSSITEYILHSLMILIGSVALCVGFCGSLQTLLAKIAASNGS
jgi:hypothetical protein